MESQKARGLAALLLTQCKKHGLTVSVAESLTGGLLGAYLSSVPGASESFKGGVISYSVTLKQEILKVNPDTIALHGVVSSQCAEEMARGVRVVCNADIGVALTGYAGPDVDTDGNVGDVWISVASKGSTFTCLYQFSDSDRDEVRFQAVIHALEECLFCIEDE